MRMLITHVHTLITHPPSPTSILWSSQSVWFILLFLLFFISEGSHSMLNNRIATLPPVTYTSPTCHPLSSPQVFTFKRGLQLYFPVRCGFWSSDPGLWNMREAFASPDWWIKPKQTPLFKNPSMLCWNYQAVVLHIHHGCFSLLHSFTLLSYLFYLYLGPLCVWYVYRKSITATHCQHWGAGQEKKNSSEGPQKGEAADDNAGENWRFELLTAALSKTQRFLQKVVSGALCTKLTTLVSAQWDEPASKHSSYGFLRVSPLRSTYWCVSGMWVGNWIVFQYSTLRFV